MYNKRQKQRFTALGIVFILLMSSKSNTYIFKKIKFFIVFKGKIKINVTFYNKIYVV